MSSHPSSPPSSEQTPLLSQQEDESTQSYTEANGQRSPAVQSLRSLQSGKKHRRWPTIIALAILCIAVIAACFALAAPSVVEEYAKEAVVFEPDRLSIDSFTSTGVRARVQGSIYLDASRVHKKPVRDLGRAATWIAREVESGDSDVEVYLPDYSDKPIGVAHLPPVKINIRNKYYNDVDFLTDLQPGDVDGIRRIAKEFMEGKLKKLRVKAVARVPLKTGLLKLGSQTVEQLMTFQGNDVPAVPDIDIQKLRLAEHGQPGHPDGMKATAEVSIMNDYPVNFDVPPLAFEVMVADCFHDYLLLGTARTEVIHIMPKQIVNASVDGLVQQLPTSLTTACPGSSKSPLDSLIGDYLAGRGMTVFIKGGQQDENTPDWIGQLLRDTTVPFSLPGHPFDNLIKNFSLANVHFSLPSADEGNPKISALVKVLVGLPAEMNLDLDVDRVRADADVYYQSNKLGKLDLSKWQAANATKVGSDLLVESVVDQAPLEITNDTVFSEVVQKLVFGHGVHLGVQANVDVNTFTVLGEFVVRNIPAQGKIFIKPLMGRFEGPQISEMEIVEATQEALTLQAKVNITNPTEYSAHVPHVNVSLWVNETRVGYAWTAVDIVPGPNDVVMRAAWEVSEVGREWLSQFVSGHNTSLTVRSHPTSIPSLPDVGLELTVPTPHMFGKFLKDATMHLITSTATFVLVSPFAMYVTSIAAQAFFNGSEIGTIDWEYPFALKEGVNETPRLPVEWGSNALGTIRDAIGGTLKLDARADVGVRIGEWREQIWYEGSGIGAKIRL